MEGNTVAKIALQAATYAIDKPYDYLVPPELEGQVLPGMRVAVLSGAETVGRMASCSPWNGRRRTHPH